MRQQFYQISDLCTPDKKYCMSASIVFFLIAEESKMAFKRMKKNIETQRHINLLDKLSLERKKSNKTTDLDYYLFR